MARPASVFLTRDEPRGRPRVWCAAVRAAEAPGHATVVVSWGVRGRKLSTRETRVAPGDARPPYTTALGEARARAVRLARAKLASGYSVVASRSTLHPAPPTLPGVGCMARFQDEPRKWTRAERVFVQPRPHGLPATLSLAPPRLTVPGHGAVPLALVTGLAAAVPALARHVGEGATLHGFLVAAEPDPVVGPAAAAEAVRTSEAGGLRLHVAEAFVPARPAEPFEVREAALAPAVARATREAPSAVAVLPTSCIRGPTLTTYYVDRVLDGHEGAVYRLPSAVGTADPGARRPQAAEHVQGLQARFRVCGVVARPGAPDRLAAVVAETPDGTRFRAAVRPPARLPPRVQSALLRDRATLEGRTAIVWFDEWDPERPEPPTRPVAAAVL